MYSIYEIRQDNIIAYKYNTNRSNLRKKIPVRSQHHNIGTDSVRNVPLNMSNKYIWCLLDITYQVIDIWCTGAKHCLTKPNKCNSILYLYI